MPQQLTDIDVIDEERAAQLRDNGYETPEHVAAASIEELASVENINLAVAGRAKSKAEDITKLEQDEISDQPASEQTDRSARNVSRDRTPAIIVGIGVLLCIIGAFLPWFSIEWLGTGSEVRGINRDGVFTLSIAIIAGFLAMWSIGEGRDWTVLGATGATITGLLNTGIAALYITRPLTGVETPQSGQYTKEALRSLIQIEMGLYVTLLGGLLILGGGVYSFFNGQRTVQETRRKQPIQSDQRGTTEQETKYCRECGTEVSATAKYCEECGATQE